MPDLNQDGQGELWVGGNEGVKLFLSPFDTVLSSGDSIANTDSEFDSSIISDRNGDQQPEVIANGHEGKAIVISSPFVGALIADVELLGPTPNDAVKGIHPDLTGNSEPYFALLSEDEDAVYLDSDHKPARRKTAPHRQSTVKQSIKRSNLHLGSER